MAKLVNWTGVFPAVTTQFREDYSLDIEATQRVIEGLLRDGVSGLIVCGTVGENCSLSRMEKVSVMSAAKEVVRGRVPLIAGIAEFTTDFAIETAREARKAGVDGIMVMPALVYSSKPHETVAHYERVAQATDLPIMVYNNPPIYRTDVTPEILTALAGFETIVAFKDSSGDTRRFIDVRNRVGDRFALAVPFEQPAPDVRTEPNRRDVLYQQRGPAWSARPEGDLLDRPEVVDVPAPADVVLAAREFQDASAHVVVRLPDGVDDLGQRHAMRAQARRVHCDLVLLLVAAHARDLGDARHAAERVAQREVLEGSQLVEAVLAAPVRQRVLEGPADAGRVRAKRRRGALRQGAAHPAHQARQPGPVA